MKGSRKTQPTDDAIRRTVLVAVALAGIGGHVAVQAAAPLKGHVLDINGAPVRDALVTMKMPAGAEGPSSISVFSSEDGRFALPEFSNSDEAENSEIGVRVLGYETFRTALDSSGAMSQREVVLVLQPGVNSQAVPASAWLRSIPDTPGKAILLTACIACHQFPTPEVRDFATSLKNVTGAGSAEVRKLSWHAITKFMRFKFVAVQMARGFPRELTYDFATDPKYFPPSAEAETVVADVLSEQVPGGFDMPEPYSYSAPLAVTGRTLIREYEVPPPNGIRHAVLSGRPARLWVADFSNDRLIRIDPDSGKQQDFPVPFEGVTGPHTIVPGVEGSLWVAMLFNSVVGRLDQNSGEWALWRLGDSNSIGSDGLGLVYMHDMACDANSELAPDRRGRMWVTDTANNALTSFDPVTGETRSYSAPKDPNRSALSTLMYGLVMSSDRRHLWYSQLWGNFGSFDTETLEFETVVEVPFGSGPRRPAINEKDILYMPLFGTGQILEFDTRTGARLGLYDLPDRASGPYAVTWDPLRRVLWVATSNTDAIYRFDPESKSFAVLPLPRPKTFLRMLSVDPATGWLVTSAGNLPRTVDGPRTALIIDPGDEISTALAKGSKSVAQIFQAQ